MKTQKGGSRTVIIIVCVLLVVLIVTGSLLGYYYVNHYKSVKIPYKVLINGLIDSKMPKRITNGSIPASRIGNEFAISFWIYISDYNYRYDEDKCLFYRGKVYGKLNNADNSPMNHNNQGAPGIWFLKNNNTLRVQVGTETSHKDQICGDSTEGFDNHSNNTPTSTSSSEDHFTHTSHCDVPYFPLQKWVYVCVAITGSSIDVYLDGKLVKSSILNGHAMTTNDDLYVCQDGGINGYLSNIAFRGGLPTLKMIESIYKKGPKIN